MKRWRGFLGLTEAQILFYALDLNAQQYILFQAVLLSVVHSEVGTIPAIQTGFISTHKETYVRNRPQGFSVTPRISKATASVTWPQ
jgi:hypothetical protein